jgi:hypothetical protein
MRTETSAAFRGRAVRCPQCQHDYVLEQDDDVSCDAQPCSEEPTWNQLLGMCVMGGAILTPTVALWGAGRLHLSDPRFLLVLTVATWGGAVGWLVYTWHHRLPVTSALCGGLMGAGIVLAILFYNATSLHRIEVYLLCAFGAAPGLGLHFLAKHLLQPANGTRAQD